MLLNLNHAIAFSCPYCGEWEVKKVSFFILGKKKEESFKCPSCSKKPMSLVREKSGKYTLSILCPICMDWHKFIIRPISFWTPEKRQFLCEKYGNILSVTGNVDAVEKSVKEHKTEDFFSELLNNFEEDDSGETLPDNVLYEDILYIEFIKILNNIAEGNKLMCSCGCHEIELDFVNKGAKLLCVNCGNSKVIDIQTMEDLNSFKKLKKIVLTEKGG